MKTPWFKKWGWIYRPNNLLGVVLLIVAAAFVATAFVAIDRHSHSASDTLYGVFPYAACTFLLLNWVAANTSNVSREL